MRLGHRLRHRLARFGMSLLLLAFIAFLAFPIVWLTSTAFKPAGEIGLQNPALLPRQPTLDNFRVAVEENGVLRSAYNTLKISVLSAVLTLLVALPAAYLLARRRSRMPSMALVTSSKSRYCGSPDAEMAVTLPSMSPTGRS